MGFRDSNPQPSDLEAEALATALLNHLLVLILHAYYPLFLTPLRANLQNFQRRATVPAPVIPITRRLMDYTTIFMDDVLIKQLVVETSL